MTDTAPTPAPDDDAVAISPEAVAQGYQQALADETQRRIIAEAAVNALRAERAELRAQVADLQAAVTTPAPNA